MSLAGRAAVVTGAGRGIGAAVAGALCEAGASVAVVARSADQTEQVAAALRKAGHRAAAFTCDVSDPGGVRAMARDAARELGPVEILVNNAGIATSAPIVKLALKEWNRTMAVNATGALLCTQAFLPGMIERGWGRVVNVASVAGVTGGRYIAAYSASKHALIGLTRCCAAEVEGLGVTANAVCPGYVDTDMTRWTLARIREKTGLSEEDAMAGILADMPGGRLIRPEEVAGAVLELCTEESGKINGEAIILDGSGA